MNPWRALAWPGDDDRGSAAAQLAVLLPVFVMFYGLVTYSGRSATAQASTEGAARWAARTISIARDPSMAVGDAEADAAATLAVGSRTCESMAFGAAVSDSEVTVTITCEVDVSELMLLPIPGSRAIEATATEVRDRYREGPGA